jgi:hypothetical protein
MRERKKRKKTERRQNLIYTAQIDAFCLLLLVRPSPWIQPHLCHTRYLEDKRRGDSGKRVTTSSLSAVQAPPVSSVNPSVFSDTAMLTYKTEGQFSRIIKGD